MELQGKMNVQTAEYLRGKGLIQYPYQTVQTVESWLLAQENGNTVSHFAARKPVGSLRAALGVANFFKQHLHCMYAQNATKQDGDVPCVQSCYSVRQKLRHYGIRKIKMGFLLLKGFFIFLSSFSDLNFASRAFRTYMHTCIYLLV